MEKINLAVIFGGETVEHEVSIISALQAMEHVDKRKYNILPLYIDKNRDWYYGKILMDMDVMADFDNLKRYAKKINLIRKNGAVVIEAQKGLRTTIEIDMVFPIVHGKNIEDGSLIGYLEMLKVPYIGSNIIASSIAQDKIIHKQILNDTGLPIVDYVWFYDFEYHNNPEPIIDNIEKLKYPVIIKPATLGSSVGIKVATDLPALKKAISEAINYDNKIIVETVVSNLKEINCAVLGNHENVETSYLQEMHTENELLTYADKYEGGAKGKMGKTGKFSKGKMGSAKMSVGMDNAFFTIPAKLTKKLEQEIYDLSIKTYKALNLTGVVRIDLLVDTKTNKVYINEPNVIPGSLSFFLFTPKGKSYTEMIDELVNYAIKDFKNKISKTSSFETNILKMYNAFGAKGKMGQ